MSLKDERVDLMMVKKNVQIHILFKVLLDFVIIKKKKLKNFQVSNIQIFWFDIWCLKISFGCGNINKKHSSENFFNIVCSENRYLQYIINIYFKLEIFLTRSIFNADENLFLCYFLCYLFWLTKNMITKICLWHK